MSHDARARLMQNLPRDDHEQYGRFVDAVYDLPSPLSVTDVRLLFSTFGPEGDHGANEAVTSRLEEADRSDYLMVLFENLDRMAFACPDILEDHLVRAITGFPHRFLNAAALLAPDAKDALRIFIASHLSDEPEAMQMTELI